MRDPNDRSSKWLTEVGMNETLQTLASGWPWALMHEEEAIAPRAGAMRAEIETSAGTIHVFNFHLPTPRDTDFISRRRASKIVRNWVDRIEGPMLVVGDFNMPVESAVYGEFWSDRQNAFSTTGTGWGWTKHKSWYGVRLDRGAGLALPALLDRPGRGLGSSSAERGFQPGAMNKSCSLTARESLR